MYMYLRVSHGVCTIYRLVRKDEEEANDDSLNIYEFLQEINVAQEDEVPPAGLQAAIAASFKSQRQEHSVAKTAEEANHVLLKRAMQASIEGDTEMDMDLPQPPSGDDGSLAPAAQLSGIASGYHRSHRAACSSPRIQRQRAVRLARLAHCRHLLASESACMHARDDFCSHTKPPFSLACSYTVSILVAHVHAHACTEPSNFLTTTTVLEKIIKGLVYY
jgi:hypothetical protein